MAAKPPLVVTSVLLRTAASRTKPVIGHATVVLNGELELPGFEIWERVPGRLTCHPPYSSFGNVGKPIISIMQDKVLRAWEKARAEGMIK